MNKIRIYLSLILIILIPSVLACGRKSGRKSTINNNHGYHICLLYTSDAADDLLCVDIGGRRIIKKKTTQ